ncbi:hypothetical protein FAGAP_7156 [Fusarium agapanthi]|uniref:Uncharacterized protein n=1 Tax=Fusarium agapanthi TaxID=1803897 RepID=A0A9P5B6T5_9HYPO|nr:hypothetical protein FAGAP_7156 [Fusarium agapanthi]
MFHARFVTAVVAGLLGAQRVFGINHGKISEFDGKSVRWQELAKAVFTGVPENEWDDRLHKRSAVELDINEIVGNTTNYVLLLGYSAWLSTTEYVSIGNLWKFLNKPFVANAGGVAIAGVISGRINEAIKKECSTESPDNSQADIIRTALQSVIDKNTEAGEVSIDISGPSGMVKIKIKAGPPNTSPNPEYNQGSIVKMTAKHCSHYESWWYSDTARYEYLKSDLFWTLAVLIIVNCWWSAKQVDSFPDQDSKNDKKDGKDRPGFWLKDRITSRLRKYLALLVCTSVFPLLLLHGSWVVKSAWRISLGLVNRTYPSSLRPRMLGFTIYSPIATIMLLAWVAVLGAGVFIVATQILLWIKIWEIKTNAQSLIFLRKHILKKVDGDGDEIKEGEQEGTK